MQKISPLRASLDAFNKFKANRVEDNKKKENSKQSNPFGLTFKGAMVSMDVFELSAPKADNNDSIQERFNRAGKLVSSAWVSTLNKLGSMKQSAISFGNRLKENTVSSLNKIKEIGNTKIEFTSLFQNSPSNLAKRPVSELEEMMKSELSVNAA